MSPRVDRERYRIRPLRSLIASSVMLLVCAALWLFSEGVRWNDRAGVHITRSSGWFDAHEVFHHRFWSCRLVDGQFELLGNYQWWTREARTRVSQRTPRKEYTFAIQRKGSRGLLHPTHKPDEWWRDSSASERKLWFGFRRFGFAVLVVRGYVRDKTQLGPPRPCHWMNMTVLVLPLWFPTLLAGLWALKRAVPLLRHSYRARHGQCLTCGYDLRGSPDRCPECGTEAKVSEPRVAQPQTEPRT